MNFNYFLGAVAEKEKALPKTSVNDSETKTDVSSNDKHLNLPEEARKDEEEREDEQRTKSPSSQLDRAAKSFELPKNFADLTNVQVLPLDKLTTSWSNASIAVQIGMDEQKQLQQQMQQQQQQKAQQQQITTETDDKSNEMSGRMDTNADNDDDDSGQLFYIPLQAVTRNTSAQGGQQLIQGVAVKLGTEGPTGPNQRVLLKAKLVTKPPISVARCPPIGTVQPTARTPQSAEQTDVPSTSNVAAGVADFKLTSTEDKETKTASLTSKSIVSIDFNRYGIFM